MSTQNCSRCHNRLCIRKVSIFSQLSQEDMVDVLKLTKHPSYGKSEVICNEGDRLATLFIVNEGMVKLSKFNAEGKEQILTLIGEGEIFGEYHLFSDYEPYNFTARAITDVKLCTLSKEQMDGLLDQHPVISRKILAELSAKLILTEKLVQNLSTVSSEAKVAYVLLFLADKYGVKDSEGIGFELPMNREDLANYAGVTRETMSRKLGLLTKEGIISTIGNKIILVKDYEALAHLAGV